MTTADYRQRLRELRDEFERLAKVRKAEAERRYWAWVKGQ